MQNPMMQIQQLSQFMQGLKGNPEAEARKLIQSSNMSQAELNQLQNEANQMYSMARQMGLMR